MKNNFKRFFVIVLSVFMATFIVSCNDLTKALEDYGVGEKYTITYESAHGDLKAAQLDKPVEKTKNSKLGKADIPALENDGDYEFQCWYYKGTKVEAEIGDEITKNIILEAVWKYVSSSGGGTDPQNVEKCKVKYESAYGDLDAAGLNKTFEMNKDSIFESTDLPKLAKDGDYEFQYWYYKGTENKAAVGDKITRDITLVAEWKEISSSGGNDNPQDEKITITVYGHTNEFPSMVQKYINNHPELNINLVTKVIDTNDDYEDKLDVALKRGEVDLYGAEAGFALKYTRGVMSDKAATYKSLGIDVDKKIEEAEIVPYIVDIGKRGNDVVALGYQSTDGCFIYNRTVAKNVFGTDDPAEIQKKIGGNTGSWDNFWEAAEACGKKGVAILSGVEDLWRPYQGSSSSWIKNGKLYIDPKREDFLDNSKTLVDKKWVNGTTQFVGDWYTDIAEDGDKKVLGYFGPAWLINYVMDANSGDTYGDWAICNSPVAFSWGGTWILASKKAAEDSKKKAIIKDIIEWITLDTTNDGLLYQWANGTFNNNGKKDTISSLKVIKNSDGKLEFLNNQNMYDYYGKSEVNNDYISLYDSTINQIWLDEVEEYANGKKDYNSAIKDFKEAVYRELGIEALPSEVTFKATAVSNGIRLNISVPAHTDYAIFRFKPGTTNWSDWEYEVYRIYNRDSSKAFETTILDRYGIEKGKTYQYGILINWDWDQLQLMDATVTATADGLEPPEITNSPKITVKPIEGKIEYSVLPTIDFSDGNTYGFRFEQSYYPVFDGEEEEELLWDYGYYPQYNTYDKDSDGNDIIEIEVEPERRGFMLALQDYTLMIDGTQQDDCVQYVRHFKPDTFEDIPQRMYLQNKVEETKEGIEFTVNVPKGTTNVQIMTLDGEEEIELVAHYYGDPTEENKTIKMTEKYEYKAGEEKYFFIKYNWGLRLDGYKDDTPQFKQGIVFTPSKDGWEAPVIKKGPSATFDGTNFKFTEAEIEWKNGEDKLGYYYDNQFHYYAKDSDGNHFADVWLNRQSGDITVGRDEMSTGIKLVRDEGGNFWINYLDSNRHWKIPEEMLTGMPKTVTINKEKLLPAEAEEKIRFNITIPDHVTQARVERREVDLHADPLTDFEEVGNQWPKANYEDEWEKETTKEFIEHYTVQKGHYYEYRVVFSDENWEEFRTDYYGFHLAGKDANPKPSLATGDNYPTIKIDWSQPDAMYWELKNENIMDTVNFEGGAKPSWITHNLSYSGWRINVWFGNGDYKVCTYSWDDYNNLPCGSNELTDFVICSHFGNEYFDARLRYDVKDLDEEKIDKTVWRVPDELPAGGFKIKFALPWNNEVYSVHQIFIERREKPSDPSIQYVWPMTPEALTNAGKTRRGFLNESDFDSVIKDGEAYFYDYFDIEKGKEYQFRAVLKVNDNWDLYEIPLGEYVATKSGYTTPTFKTKPTFTWDENGSLKLTNKPELVVDNSVKNQWGLGNDWNYGIGIAYLDPENVKTGYWPGFTLNSNNEIQNDKSDIPDWDKESLKKIKTLVAMEYYVYLLLPDQILPSISYDIDEYLGDLKTINLK